jgi:hypothetical protein
MFKVNYIMTRFKNIKLNQIFIGTALTAGLAFTYTTVQKAFEVTERLCQTQFGETTVAKTELLFGLSKPDGSIITEPEFQQFIDREVTPLFPDGLTLMNVTGQFKDSKNVIIKEKSKLLLLLHRNDRNAQSNIEQIRKAYVTKFHQESVLRVDETSCISF